MIEAALAVVAVVALVGAGLAVRELHGADERADGLASRLAEAHRNLDAAAEEVKSLYNRAQAAERNAEHIRRERDEAAEAHEAEVLKWADSTMAMSAEIERLEAERRAVVPVPELTPEQRAELLRNKCQHCGGTHAIACPRVRELWYRPNGLPLRVAYWAHGEYPTDEIVWPTDL